MIITLALAIVLLLIAIVGLCLDNLRKQDEIETLEAQNKTLSDRLDDARMLNAYKASAEFARRSQAAIKGHETRRKKREAQLDADVKMMIGDTYK